MKFSLDKYIVPGQVYFFYNFNTPGKNFALLKVPSKDFIEGKPWAISLDKQNLSA